MPLPLKAPTVTNYDWAHMVSESGSERRMKRSADGAGLVSVETSLTRLETGRVGVMT